MATLTTELFQITCITNMHVGSGGTNYGIVDNLVQRDPTTGYPVINSSSLKGALREFCNEHHLEPDKVKYIFGSDVKDGGDKTEPGRYKFFSAHLLSIPLRSNQKPYFNATSPTAVNDFLGFCEKAGIDLKTDKDALAAFAGVAGGVNIFETIAGTTMIEGKQATSGTLDASKLKVVKKYVGDNPTLWADSEFEEAMKGLPVIARNHLENGISQNLWYEEVVPRQSRFYFAVLHDGNHFDEFKTKIEAKMVQIGANATVGYGYCTIKKLDVV